MGSWPRGAAHCRPCSPFPTASPRLPGSAVPVSFVPPLWSLGAGHVLGCAGSRSHWRAPDPAGWGLCGWIWRVLGEALGLTLPPFPCRAGGVCALISNTRFSQAVKSTFPNVNNTLDNIHTYLASIPQARTVPLPRLGGKGPGGRSSPNSPLGKGSRGAGSRESSPPSLTPHLCPYSKLILSSTRVMSH